MVLNTLHLVKVDLIENKLLRKYCIYHLSNCLVFLTTNQIVDEISSLLEKAENKDHNTVHFLDVTITNQNGHLTTTIYYKPTDVCI